MSKRKCSLVCVSHPDDETLFFGGLLQRKRKYPWTVICVTDGNADGQGKLRYKQFQKAMAALGVKNYEWLGFPDKFEERLDIASLIERLKLLPATHGEPYEIFTHGILGEYEHPHHQDVSYAVHHAFEGHPRLYSAAYNSYPSLHIQLTAKEYAVKSKVLIETYGSETSRFINFLPSTYAEGFLKLDLKEVETIYHHIANGKPLKVSSLKAYAWMIKHLKGRKTISRPF